MPSCGFYDEMGSGEVCSPTPSETSKADCLYDKKLEFNADSTCFYDCFCDSIIFIQVYRESIEHIWDVGLSIDKWKVDQISCAEFPFFGYDATCNSMHENSPGSHIEAAVLTDIVIFPLDDIMRVLEVISFPVCMNVGCWGEREVISFNSFNYWGFKATSDEYGNCTIENFETVISSSDAIDAINEALDNWNESHVYFTIRF